MSDRREVISEKDLVERCLTGEGAAWQALYDRYQPKLLVAVACRLGRRAKAAEIADEITARVWYALVARDYARLRKFNPGRGGLRAYLALIARQEIQKLYRSDIARQRRQVPLRAEHLTRPGDPLLLHGVLWEEFVATLSRQERAFLQHSLLGCGAPSWPSLTLANARKHKQRVLRKLLAFLAAG